MLNCELFEVNNLLSLQKLNILKHGKNTKIFGSNNFSVRIINSEFRHLKYQL